MDAKIVREASVHAVIVRADGTKVDLGEVANSKWGRLSKESREARKRIKQANKQAGL